MVPDIANKSFYLWEFDTDALFNKCLSMFDMIAVQVAIF